MNLLLNAIEAMKETGGVLTVKTQLGENSQLLISVSDTGMGLPKEKTEQIFDAFFTTKPQGSGMGLSISRSAAPLSSPMVAICGPRRTTDGVQRSISLCRPQPRG
jgi:signal transduction histidine kinase